MVDVVINHFAWNGDVDSIQHGALTPFDQQSDYHSYCAIDYSNIANQVSLELNSAIFNMPMLTLYGRHRSKTAGWATRRFHS
jgi:hypothetical protein